MNEQRIREIVRSEVRRMIRALMTAPGTDDAAPSPVAVWVASLPVGETGRAGAWLKRYRATTGSKERLGASAFGRELSSLVGEGRFLSRRKSRENVYVYTRGA